MGQIDCNGQILAHVLDHLPDPTTTATGQELVAMLQQHAQAFSAHEEALRYHGYYGRTNELQGKLREALHKASNTIHAARSWSVTRLRRVASRLGLWDAFWRELPPPPEIEKGIRALCQHTLITQHLRQNHYQALVSEWNARVQS